MEYHIRYNKKNRQLSIGVVFLVDTYVLAYENFQDPRVCGSIRGLCPLSPDARRRASSLLDQRNLHTPSPSRPIVWKFNTVNEAIVHSSRWRDFDPETNLE